LLSLPPLGLFLSLVPLLLPLGLFLSPMLSLSPLYHCYLSLSMALSLLPSCVTLCHCSLPFAITPFPWVLFFPCVIIISFLPLLFLCDCYLSLHCSFPFANACPHLPLFSSRCHNFLPFAITTCS
jgi:hypothetical protein